MKRSEVEHILRAAKEITGEEEFILIGSQSALGAFPDAPLVLRKSIELDIYPKSRPEKSELIDGAIGERSLFHETHGYFAHGVAPETAHLPVGWESRLVRMGGENTRGAIGWCLDVHDLALSKIAAGRRKDMEFVGNLLRHKTDQANQTEAPDRTGAKSRNKAAVNAEICGGYFKSTYRHWNSALKLPWPAPFSGRLSCEH